MKKVSKHRMVMKKQVQQVFFERDILAFAENPFVVGLWCTFQSKVGPALISAHLATAVQLVSSPDPTLLRGETVW